MTVEDRCRHCGDRIRRHTGRHADSWNHMMDDGSLLHRCQRPGRRYGYDALPDTGKPCDCWACQNYGQTSPELTP